MWILKDDLRGSLRSMYMDLLTKRCSFKDVLRGPIRPINVDLLRYILRGPIKAIKDILRIFLEDLCRYKCGISKDILKAPLEL